MKKIIYLFMFLVLTYSIYAGCSVEQRSNNITIYDTIVAKGVGAVCNSSIYLDGAYVDSKLMSTAQGIIYTANYSSLQTEKNYYSYIYCEKSGVYYYSDCYFALSPFAGEGTAIKVDSSQLSYKYYMSVNQTEEIKLITNTTGNHAYIIIEGVSYLMTSHTGYFSVLLTNPARADVGFMVNKTDASNITLYTANGTMRWRIPFYVDVYVYKSSKFDNSSQLYTDEFQYIFLKKRDSVSYATNDFSYLQDWADNINSVTGRVTSGNLINSMDTSLALWSYYTNGKARIKVYEAGNYTINLVATKTRKSVSWQYEFIYPQDSSSQYYKSIAQVNLDTEQSQSVKVYADMWSISWLRAMMNWVLIAVIVIIFLAGLIASFYTGNVYIISGVFFIGGAIALAVIGRLIV